MLNSLGLRLVPQAVALLMRIWFSTCRLTIHNPENFFHPHEKDKRAIASFWHYSIIYTFYFLRHYSATVMVSASRDGDYIARLAEEFDFDTVRGSKNHKGVGALKSILRAVRNGENAAIVADGSQGPPLILQPGVILLASRTGVPVVPMAWSASSCFTVRSWDRTAIPKPFARVDYFYGKPLLVPAELTVEDIERYRLLLENRLNTLYALAWSVHNSDGH